MISARRGWSRQFDLRVRQTTKTSTSNPFAFTCAHGRKTFGDSGHRPQSLSCPHPPRHEPLCPVSHLKEYMWVPLRPNQSAGAQAEVLSLSVGVCGDTLGARHNRLPGLVDGSDGDIGSRAAETPPGLVSIRSGILSEPLW